MITSKVASEPELDNSDGIPGAPGLNSIIPLVYPLPPSVTNTSDTLPNESIVTVAFPPSPSPRIGMLVNDLEIG